MAGQLFAYIEHKGGVADDTALELLTAASQIDPGAKVTAIVMGSGDQLDAVCKQVAGAYPEVWKISSGALAYPNAEIIRKLLINLLPGRAILLVPHDSFGMDLSPGLAIKLDSAFAPDVGAIQGLEGNELKIMRQEFNGQVSTRMTCDLTNGAVINLRPGVCAAPDNPAASGQIIDKSAEVQIPSVGRRFLEVVEAEMGDVDITKSDVLVSIGRGIEDQENIGIAEELAEAMGAVVSCSRPIVDAKWLEKSRQVGTSGKTVKPKVYLALGISGSFQHMGGLKGAPFIVAVNKNPKAPIFQVADVGVVADILEFVPELTEKIKER
jgi:electron transfer flavoprotein alpha subunit